MSLIVIGTLDGIRLLDCEFQEYKRLGVGLRADVVIHRSGRLFVLASYNTIVIVCVETGEIVSETGIDPSTEMAVSRDSTLVCHGVGLKIFVRSTETMDEVIASITVPGLNKLDFLGHSVVFSSLRATSSSLWIHENGTTDVFAPAVVAFAIAESESRIAYTGGGTVYVVDPITRTGPSARLRAELMCFSDESTLVVANDTTVAVRRVEDLGFIAYFKLNHGIRHIAPLSGAFIVCNPIQATTITGDQTMTNSDIPVVSSITTIVGSILL